MFRKACLILIFLLFASACFASDLRSEGARAYILGFLAGDGEVYSNSAALRDDVLFVLRRLAYPLSSWSWGQAVIERESVNGDLVTLEVVRPDISKFFSGKRPETVEEWAGFLSLSRSFPETDKMKEEITLKVNAVGELEISKETKKKMLDEVVNDLLSGIQWCCDHREVAPKEYLLSMYSEVSHGLISVPSDVIEKIKIFIEGDKK